MSLVINNNLMAQNAQRNLSKSYGELSSSVRKLSSGLRIGTAADDAAGLAIRELMRSDISTTQQGIRNANDAISMIQTADGALGVIDEKLIRMKTLAEQASTGTYNSTQRMIIDSEYQAMASEITRISNSTEFNGIKLLDGSISGPHAGNTLGGSGAVRIHFGTGNSSAEDYYDIRIGGSSASALGLGNTTSGPGATISTQAAAQSALAALDNAIVSKDKIRAHLGGLQNRLEATVDNLQIQNENLQASESRISDIDVSQEMTNFVRNQILTQSAVAMLSQANSLPRMAQQLIGG